MMYVETRIIVLNEACTAHKLKKIQRQVAALKQQGMCHYEYSLRDHDRVLELKMFWESQSFYDLSPKRFEVIGMHHQSIRHE